MLSEAYNDADDEWYITQLKTTMNFDTPPAPLCGIAVTLGASLTGTRFSVAMLFWRLDWVHIGLQFQIEHHLFPRLPRHNLRPLDPTETSVLHDSVWLGISVATATFDR